MSDVTALPGAAGREPIVLDGDAVRGRGETREFAVSGAQLAAYAAATGDTRPSRVAGEVASPAFGFVPLTRLLFDVAAKVAGDVGPTGLVHTHQRFRLRAPVVAGERLRLDAHVADLRDSRFGGVVTIVAETSGEDGTALGTQVVTALVVGSTTVNPIEDPEHAPPDLAARAGQAPTGGGRLPVAVDRDHPARYADASGDRNPIHLDAAFARAQGFPGPIAHGMCTLALSCHALEAMRGTEAEPARLEVEFTRPVFPGDDLTVRWHERTGGYGFDVVNRKQRVVLRSGLLTWPAVDRPRQGRPRRR
jgi:acyl dehydratase